MNEKYNSTEQVQDTPVVNLASNWEELRKTTDNIASIYGKFKLESDKLAIQSNKYSIATQVMNLSTEAKMEADKQLNPVDAAKTYKAVMQGGSEGISTHVMDVNKSYAKEVLAFKVDQAKQDLSGAIATRAKQNAYSSFTSSYDTFSNEANNAANRGDKVAAATLYGQAKGLVVKAVGSGALDPVRGGVFTQKLQKDFHTNIVVGQYRNAIATGDSAQFKKEFMKSKAYDAYLNPRDKQALMAKFSSMDKAAAATDGINNATWGQNFQGVLFDTSHGIAVSTKKLADLAAADPVKYQKGLVKLREAQASYVIASKFNDASVASLKAGITELTNPEDVAKTYQEQAVKLNAAKQLKVKLHSLETDPASVAVHSQAYQAVIATQKAKGKLDPIGARIAYQKHLGLQPDNISALTKEEAYNTVASIKQQTSLQDQLKALSAYEGTVKPANRPYAMRDLQKAGLPIASQYMLRISKDPDAVRYSITAAKAWDNIQESKGTEHYDKAFDQYSQMLGTQHSETLQEAKADVIASSAYHNYADVILSSGGSAKRLSDYAKHYQLLTFQLMMDGTSLKDASKLADGIMNAGTSIGTYGGNKYVYDKKMDQSLITGACNISISNHKMTDDVQIPARYMADLGGVDRKDALDMYLGGASFRNTPDQSGLMMVDVNNNPILDKSGKKITFTFKELKEGHSKVAQQALHAQSIIDNRYQFKRYEANVERQPNLTDHNKAVLKFYAQAGVLL